MEAEENSRYSLARVRLSLIGQRLLCALARPRRAGTPAQNPARSACGAAQRAALIKKYRSVGRAPASQGAWSRALRPLPAPMPHEGASAAAETKGFRSDLFHDPFHAAGFRVVIRATVTTRPTPGRGRRPRGPRRL